MMTCMLHLHKICSKGVGLDFLNLHLSDLMNLPIHIPVLEVQGCTCPYIHPYHLNLSSPHWLTGRETETEKGDTGIGRETLEEGAMEVE